MTYEVIALESVWVVGCIFRESSSMQTFQVSAPTIGRAIELVSSRFADTAGFEVVKAARSEAQFPVEIMIDRGKKS